MRKIDHADPLHGPILKKLIRGLGNTKGPLVLSILSSAVFRLLWISACAAAKGTIGSIYAAYPLCWALNTGLSILLFRHLLSKAEQQCAEKGS